MLGNIELTYQLLKHTKVTWTAAEAVTPTILGDLQKITSVGVTLNHDINRLANVTLSTQFQIVTSGVGSTSGGDSASPASASQAGQVSEYITASAMYEYQLTQELKSRVSYTYSQRTDNTSSSSTATNTASAVGTGAVNNTNPVRSNTILFSLTRDFTLLH